MSVYEKFKEKNIKDWDDKTLDDLMSELSIEFIQNDMVRHRAIVQALAILNEKNSREYKKLDNRNLILTILVIALTIIQVILGLVQIFCN